MERKCTCIIDQHGIEMLVGYKSELVRHHEEGHGIHDMTHVWVDIEYVELVIAGRGIDITNRLTESQLDHIKSLIDD